MRRLLGLVFAALAATLLVAAPAQATFPGKNGKITFGADGQNTFTINPDGTGRSELIKNGGLALWSPDGRMVAFRSPDHFGCCHFASDLLVANADGTGVTRLFQGDGNGDVRSIAWSPDGTKLAFGMYFYKHSSDLYTVRPDGSGLAHIATTPGAECCVDLGGWSPDGAKLVFERTSPGSTPRSTGYVSRIDVVNADGSEEKALTSGPDDYQPQWSPRGGEIAFESSGRLLAMRPDGSGQHPLMDSLQVDPHQAFQPSWSPNGRELALRAAGDIYRQNADGSGLTNLTPDLGGDSATPAWSPDGTKIAFWREPDGLTPESFVQADIWVMNADGTAKANLTRSPGHYYLADWQPIPGPRRGDYKNSAQFCKAEQAFWGNQFSRHYRNFGQCVSSN